jgi:2-polyprenyl-3-methyl-5-hydroxy-6-metoxy-1,4-benzoquinol methylase
MSKMAMAPSACKICGSSNLRAMCTKESAHYYLCRDCALILQYPPPDGSAMQAYADEQYASGLYRDYVEARPMKLIHFRRRLESLQPLLRPGRLLDIGCSCGYFLEIAAEHGYDVHGVEFSSTAISAAADSVRARILQGTLEDMPRDQKGSFDVVSAFDLIEHIDQPGPFLDAVAEFLRPGGKVVICTPDSEHFLRYVMGSRWPMLQPMQHLSIFSRRSLQTALEKSGFTEVRLGTAYKTLSAAYLVDQIRTLNPILSKAMRACLGIFPTSFVTSYRQVNIGEIFAVATRK